MTQHSSPVGTLTVTGGMSRAEQLARAIEDRIRIESLAPGDHLGTVDELSTASGLSRPTVNESLRILRDRGIIEIRPGRSGGIFVAERGPVVRLRHTLLSVTEEPSTVAEAIELREYLELFIDLSASQARTPDDVADLRRLTDKMGEATDRSAFMTLNWRLHERIAQICHNSMARAVYIGTLGHLSDAAAAPADGMDSDGYQRERHRVHIQLVDAIASGEEDRVRAAVLRHHTSS